MSKDDSGETYDIGDGTYSVDDEDQLQSEDTLIDRGVHDILDEGYSPPDKGRGVNSFGTTASEQAQGESLDMRILQEELDPNMAFDDPLAPAKDDDPDAPRDEDEFVDDGEVGDRRAGRLVAPDEGAHEDTDNELTAGDIGIDSGAATAEEAAMHIVDDH